MRPQRDESWNSHWSKRRWTVELYESLTIVCILQIYSRKGENIQDVDVS